MSTSPESVVTAFIDGMGGSYEQVVENMRRHLRDDVEWHTGTVLRHGIEDSIAHMTQARDQGIPYWTADILFQASKGNIVFQERVDHVFRDDGSRLGDTYVCTIFELDGDQIAKWRDYYNPDELRRLMTAG